MRWSIAVVLVAVALGVPLACMLAEHFDAASPGDGTVVFVEHETQTRGRLVNGTYSSVSLGDLPYQFNAFRRALNGSGIVSNASLQAVLEDSESLSQDAGSGTTGAVYGIYGLPAGAEDIVVENLAQDGTVTLTYEGARIVLAPGERWENISTDLACTPNYSIRFTRSDVIRNQGLIDKNDID